MLTVYNISFTNTAFGQEIQITSINTSPSKVHLGDSIRINATVVNNSPGTIYFKGGCFSPLSATFDKNIVSSQAMGCLAIFNANLKPGENTTIIGPGSGNVYIANSTGTTNASVTFSYTDENKSQNTISRSFAFDILASTPIPEFPSISLVIFALAILGSIVFVSRKTRNLPRL